MPSSCSSDLDRKSTRLNSSHLGISYAVFCLKKTVGLPKDFRRIFPVHLVRSGENSGSAKDPVTQTRGRSADFEVNACQVFFKSSRLPQISPLFPSRASSD